MAELPLDAVIGARLKEHRKRLDLNQSQVAAKVGVKDKGTVSRWENGKQAISSTHAAALAKLYRTSVAALFEGSAAPAPALGFDDVKLVLLEYGATDRQRRACWEWARERAERDQPVSREHLEIWLNGAGLKPPDTRRSKVATIRP